MRLLLRIGWPVRGVVNADQPAGLVHDEEQAGIVEQTAYRVLDLTLLLLDPQPALGDRHVGRGMLRHLGHVGQIPHTRGHERPFEELAREPQTRQVG